MKIKQHNWPISKLVSDRPSINLNPTWQRGAAWKQPRKVLLIDSILRGMDIPKVYLRKFEVPPVISAIGNLVKSVFEKENGLEEAVFRRADHRFFAAG